MTCRYFRTSITIQTLEVWFCHRTKVPFREYLLALCDAESLFVRGLPTLHHQQTMAYYQACLQAPDDKLSLVLPNCSASVYYAAAGMKKKGRRPAPVVDVFALHDDTGRNM
jgi:hypothetical protein